MRKIEPSVSYIDRSYLFWESEFEWKMARLAFETYNIAAAKMTEIINNGYLPDDTAVLSGIILNLDGSEDLFLPLSFTHLDKYGTKTDLLSQTFGAEIASYARSKIGSNAVFYVLGVLIVGGLMVIIFLQFCYFKAKPIAVFEDLENLATKYDDGEAPEDVQPETEGKLYVIEDSESESEVEDKKKKGK